MEFFDLVKKQPARRIVQTNTALMSQQQKALVELMSAMQWMGEGVGADEMPGGGAEFGMSAEKPIPCKTVFGSMAYRDSLRTADGSKMMAERLGSHGSNVSSSPVDRDLIRHVSGKELAKIFLSPYQRRVSRKAPRGFRLA